MIVTSAKANKILRQLGEDISAIETSESNSREFVAAISEDLESVRPEYDFSATNKQLWELNNKVRKIKHAINVFNATTVVPELNMTIDEVLVYIPQLTQLKTKLSRMRGRLVKTRERSIASSTIEYRYLNYDPATVEAEFKRVSDLLTQAQTALDIVNTTVTFELDI